MSTWSCTILRVNNVKPGGKRNRETIQQIICQLITQLGCWLIRGVTPILIHLRDPLSFCWPLGLWSYKWLSPNFILPCGSLSVFLVWFMTDRDTSVQFKSIHCFNGWEDTHLGSLPNHWIQLSNTWSKVLFKWCIQSDWPQEHFPELQVIVWRRSVDGLFCVWKLGHVTLVLWCTLICSVEKPPYSRSKSRSRPKHREY